MMHAPFAAIFDMDGVIANTIPYHFKAWIAFWEKRGISITQQQFQETMNGRTNAEILNEYMDKTLTDAELKAYIDEKESLYRELFRPHLQPVPGVREFLTELQAQNIPIALGTAAPEENVSFVLDGTGTKKFFPIIVNGEGDMRGKPAPDIYLACIKALDMPANTCVVFEDAPLGVAAARAAGAHVVGVTTTETAKNLGADITIQDFTEITMDDVQKLLV